MIFLQISITTTPQKIANSHYRRGALMLTPTVDMYIGDATVTAANGLLIKAGVTVNVIDSGEIWGVVALVGGICHAMDQERPI